jgi:hypothetical protein
LAFAERAARQIPSHSVPIHEIAALYARLRYGATPLPDDLGALKNKVAAFRP